MSVPARDHGGGLDEACARFGGSRSDWIDLSTGINPQPYPLPDVPVDAWTALPDSAGASRLEAAARRWWQVPDEAAVLAAPGASALIALIPLLATPGAVSIPAPTYNEHAAAFAAQGWHEAAPDACAAQVVVHPNNPDGRLHDAAALTAPLVIIDESFCDVNPRASLIAQAGRPGCLVLKSFGKFWGLAGLRLGFVIGDPALVDRLAALLGPWPVSGAAQVIGARALQDADWADATRRRLAQDARRLDALMQRHGATLAGGCDLFRLYDTDDARALHDHLARQHILTRVFPYSRTWLRMGLPASEQWARVEAAL